MLVVAVVFTENGAGTADQPAVSALVYPVPIRFLVACTDRGHVPTMERPLFGADLCRVGAAHAGVQRFARLRLLPPVSADTPPAAATTLCRALAVADL